MHYIYQFQPPRGWGVLPIMGYTGRFHPEGVPFQVFRYERVGNLLVEVYERVGKSVILICK